MASSFCVHKAIHMLLKCYIECAIQYRKAEPGSTLMALKDLIIKTATRTSALVGPVEVDTVALDGLLCPSVPYVKN
jgi:hypothetical protein